MLPISAQIIAHQKEEQRLPHSVTGPIVVHKLCHWLPACPIVLFVISDKVEECFDPLIHALQLSIHSGVIGCGYVLFYSHQFAQFSRKF